MAQAMTDDGAVSPVMFRLQEHAGSDVLHPTPHAASQWSGGGTMRGLAVSAVMARAAERAVEAGEVLRPVRWTVDLSRPVPMRPSTVRVEIVRTGRRLRLADVELVQDGVVMARARALFLAPRDVPSDGWEPERALAMPPPGLVPETPEPRVYYSEDVGWSTRAGEHHNRSRKQVWAFPFVVVEGEAATPFQLAAGNADLASVVAHWTEGGLAHINADITLALARLPGPTAMGIAGLERVASGGVGIGAAHLHDVHGVFGLVTVCALWNGDALVDPAARDRDRRGDEDPSPW